MSPSPKPLVVGCLAHRHSVAALLLGALAVLSPASGAAETEAAAKAASTRRAVLLIVHPANPVTDVSPAAAKALLRGERQFWPSSRPVNLAFPSDRGEEAALVRVKIFGKDREAFRAYWLRRVFGGEGASPVMLDTSAEVLQYVAQHPGGLSYVAGTDKLTGVKVLTIGGQKPDSPTYFLR